MFYNITEYVKNKHYNELNNYSAYMRQAMLFKYITKEMPTFLSNT
jgi:hypothetical protein